MFFATVRQTGSNMIVPSVERMRFRGHGVRATALAQPDDRARTSLGLDGVAKVMHGSANVERVPCGDHSDDDCYAVCDKQECSIVGTVDQWDRLKITSYFGLWFLLSVGYSVTNKKVTNLLPLPYSVATATVLVGSVFVSILWATGLRRPPKLSAAALRTLVPIGTFHAIGHIAGTVGTAAGSVSFAQVVKAAGPVYACILSAIVLKEKVSRRVWLSLVPIASGVALASAKELSFAWMALGGAVVSDLALALRNVLSKKSMAAPRDEHMTPANMFGVLTCISAIVSLPIMLAAEGGSLGPAWRAATAQVAPASLVGQVCLTGLYFYGYSEVAMKALANVSPVTHAIGNTLRRVVIMVVCMLVFRTPLTALGALGSSLAIAGSYAYAIVKSGEKRAAAAVLKKAADDEAAVAAALIVANEATAAEENDPFLEEVAHKLDEALPLHLQPEGKPGVERAE